MPRISDLIRKNTDQRIRLSIRTDDVSPEARREISNLLGRQYGFSPDYTFDWRIVNKEGKLPKRIKSWMYKSGKSKVSDRIIEHIGNTAYESRFWKDEFDFRFTNDIDWQQGDFGDHDSCYWGTKEYMLDDLRRNESVYSIKIYNDGIHLDSNGWGRAILLLDFPKVGAVTAINAYPKGFQITNISRLVAKWVHSTFGFEPVTKRIHLDYDGEWKEPIWINGGNGATISMLPLLISRYNTRSYFDLNTCPKCEVTKSYAPRYDELVGQRICEDCRAQHFFNCASCGAIRNRSQLNEFRGLNICDNCVDRIFICECGNESLMYSNASIRSFHTYSGTRHMSEFGVHLAGIGNVCYPCAHRICKELYGNDIDIPPHGTGRICDEDLFDDHDGIYDALYQSHITFQEIVDSTGGV
jgi:hypothetical protein